ncbi:maleylacetoacetate isomerase [Paracoccus denitrificans]|jgi:maleylpyruvate isomerase|uniref:Maleylacetoacetate isomerase n=1 Tax=Paracoccus denitrificans (strain Pd 1222) TaxID=318586 RepID=A1AYE6_PARDP|nr:maleylacetoacetate isomerase [Paracoccus denitrificans]ABL68290.1 maleylacetoacetate isomerase [Paracoccus denitrificans PD1222]MBB4627804.1 maleylpyruvate isomerase [Paracoccus denitrificans]MCU7428660.1 maleylacetoacetate isomerase [Paracoccus denitrificans]QAR26380.1 maleylacetoacetate isomerase [Paracoccus denitrificans]UPV95308.1 maleylacetoacetate isomerase [Paracoccus denitrificans]
MTRPVLHNYYRSSTSYRVRIALALKGVDYDYAALHLRKGDQRSDAFLALNPQGLVPALEWGDGQILTQSLAIIEYLDEIIPQPPLLPSDPAGRARVRSLADMIALDIHPINNLRVLAYLKNHFGADDEATAEWFRHWVSEGFAALEARLARDPQTGTFCHGDRVGLADICLAAQITNNARFGVDMTPWPTIRRIGEALAGIEAFRQAAPDRQPDNET